MTEPAEEIVYWADDAQLMGYGESDSAGAWLKFQIQPEDLEKFRGLKGTVFYAALVKRQESGAPETQKPKGGPLSQLAGQWCHNPKFFEWIWGIVAAGEPVEISMCRDFILEKCGIQSRAELDHNETAAAIFHEQIRLPFSKWLENK
jgi:hypothetical protein